MGPTAAPPSWSPTRAHPLLLKAVHHSHRLRPPAAAPPSWSLTRAHPLLLRAAHPRHRRPPPTAALPSLIRASRSSRLLHRRPLLLLLSLVILFCRTLMLRVLCCQAFFLFRIDTGSTEPQPESYLIYMSYIHDILSLAPRMYCSDALSLVYK